MRAGRSYAPRRGESVGDGWGGDGLAMECVVRGLVVAVKTDEFVRRANHSRLGSDSERREAMTQRGLKMVRGWPGGAGES